MFHCLMTSFNSKVLANTCSFLGFVVDTPALEECPKWEALGEVIAEIKEHNDKSPDTGRVLIAAEDDRTCSQIKEVREHNDKSPDPGGVLIAAEDDRT